MFDVIRCERNGRQLLHLPYRSGSKQDEDATAGFFLQTILLSGIMVAPVCRTKPLASQRPSWRLACFDSTALDNIGRQRQNGFLAAPFKVKMNRLRCETDP